MTTSFHRRWISSTHRHRRSPYLPCPSRSSTVKSTASPPLPGPPCPPPPVPPTDPTTSLRPSSAGAGQGKFRLNHKRHPVLLGAAAPPVEYAPSASCVLVPASNENMDAITNSTRSLVNFDNITTELRPLAKLVGESPLERNSVPAWALADRSPTLAEMKNAQGGSPGELARSYSQTAAQLQQPRYHVATYQTQRQQQGLAAYQGLAADSAQGGYYVARGPATDHAPAG